MHAQIVVCPGINDGDVLESSLLELERRFPEVASAAVVPVGLTSHRDGLPQLRAVDSMHALRTIELVDTLREKFTEELDTGFAYCSDEWFIRAGFARSSAELLWRFPQLENGSVGARIVYDAAESHWERARRSPVLRAVSFWSPACRCPHLSGISPRSSTA